MISWMMKIFLRCIISLERCHSITHLSSSLKFHKAYILMWSSKLVSYRTDSFSVQSIKKPCLENTFKIWDSVKDLMFVIWISISFPCSSTKAQYGFRKIKVQSASSHKLCGVNMSPVTNADILTWCNRKSNSETNFVACNGLVPLKVSAKHGRQQAFTF